MHAAYAAFSKLGSLHMTKITKPIHAVSY